MGLILFYKQYKFSFLRSEEVFCDISENFILVIFICFSTLLASIIYGIILLTITRRISFLLCRCSEILIIALLGDQDRHWKSSEKVELWSGSC